MFVIYGRISREIVEAKRNGLVDGYIEKPVSDVELVDAVRMGKQRRMGDVKEYYND
jgi:FixJ family two-component response regulator